MDTSNNRGRRHILVLSQFFYPEPFRINDMCREWVDRGYRVTVVTGIPNYPQGRFYEGYGLRKKRRESWHGVDIIRLPLIPRGRTPVGMVLNYLSFPVSGFFWNLFHPVQADLVFMFETSPMTQCKIGVWYAKKHRVPLFLYAQDLWPENVEVMTGIHSPLVIGPIERMVRQIYRSCTQIFATSPSFVESICRREVEPDRVHYWPQYAEEFYVPLEKKSVPEIPDDGRFKVIFTGNIGYAQGLDILPRAARLLAGKAVRFVIVGDGRYLPQLERETEGLEDMFTMVPRQSAERIPALLAACDAGFLSFQDNELFTKTIPAKLQSYLACGIPVIASAGGESRRVIEEAGCGMAAPLGDEHALAQVILELAEKSPEELKKMGDNGRNYCLEHFCKRTLMDQMDGWIAEALDGTV